MERLAEEAERARLEALRVAVRAVEKSEARAKEGQKPSSSKQAPSVACRLWKPVG